MQPTHPIDQDNVSNQDIRMEILGLLYWLEGCQSSTSSGNSLTFVNHPLSNLVQHCSGAFKQHESSSVSFTHSVAGHFFVISDDFDK